MIDTGIGPPSPSPRRDGRIARDRLERGLLATALGGRAVLTAILLTESLGGRQRYRRPNVMAAAATAQALATAWISQHAAHAAQLE